MVIDWNLLWITSMKIGAAYVLAMPTGWVREREAHGVGIRTFPIVAIASCGYLLIMQNGGTGSDALAANSRILQGLVAGIGFVGGGAILKEGMSVHGTATAASIWNTGVVGAAIGPAAPVRAASDRSSVTPPAPTGHCCTGLTTGARSRCSSSAPIR